MPSERGDLNLKSFMTTRINTWFLLPALTASLDLMPVGRVTAQTLTTLHNFAFSEGAGPNSVLILSGNTLYGTIPNPREGTLFKVNTDGTGFTNLHSFSFSDAISPEAGLISWSITPYCTTR